MLLNGIYCVYDVQDLKNFSRSITPTGMTYANHTARQINPRVYEVPFIGDNATVAQIKIAEGEVKELEELMKNHIAILILTKVSRDSFLVHMP